MIVAYARAWCMQQRWIYGGSAAEREARGARLVDDRERWSTHLPKSTVRWCAALPERMRDAGWDVQRVLLHPVGGSRYVMPGDVMDGGERKR